ncbi:MAG: hypothetical protein GXP62_02875 [Oligoflexia bacterium]|nr:hypothetical protein [Oligoflexia bacterium]
MGNRWIRRQPGGKSRQTAMTALAVAVPISACVDTGVSAQGTQVVDPVTVEETFIQQPMPKVDVLWVVDSTCSMAEEQAALVDAFGAFADALDSLDLCWQAGVVTTDVSGDDAGVLQGSPWIIHADLDDPAQAFAQAAQVGTNPLATEAGLGAAWLALSPPLIDDENRGFRRPDASLHVVVLSDGDDDSSQVLGADPAGSFEDFLASQSAANGLDAQLSAVVGDVPDGCASAQPGTTYTAVAQATGGTVASICSTSFDQVAQAVGQASIDWPVSFTLQATPVADSVDAWIDEARIDSANFSIDVDQPAIVFATPPPADSIIRVRYTLPESPTSDGAT